MAVRIAIIIPDEYIPKIRSAYTNLDDEDVISATEAKARIIEHLRNVLRRKCQDVDSEIFKATQEQYNDISGE